MGPAANLDGGAGVGAGSSGLAGSDGTGSLGRDSGSSFGSSGGTAGGQATAMEAASIALDDLFVHCYSLLIIYSLRRANACRNRVAQPITVI